jgi:putative cell wall-binding protein
MSHNGPSVYRITSSKRISMKHRPAAVALVAALASGLLAMTTTAAAAPTPAASTVATTDSVEATRDTIELTLERSADRLVRAKETQLSRAESATQDSPELAGTESTESAAGALAAAATTSRIFGINRYDTAVKISQSTFTTPASDFGGVLFVANGMNFPDALSAGPAAASMVGPILLVPPTGGLPLVVETEIQRLDPISVVILGGTDNVSAQAEAELKALVPEPNAVFRTAGTNRYKTSALLSDFVAKAVDLGGGAWDYTEPDTAIISTGLSFADALAGGAAGGWEYAPLLLTSPGGLDPAVTDVLTPIPADPGTGYPGRTFKTVRILGSTATVSTTVENQIKAILPSAKVVRYAGKDRYDTAAKLNAAVFTAPAYEVTLVNGLRFPDALAGAPRVNVTGGPTVPVRTECVPAFSTSTLTTLTPSLVTALGNVDAVSNAALAGTQCP